MKFWKTTEGIIVLGGLFLTVTLGKFWAIMTGAAYVVVNTQNLAAWFVNAAKWLKSKFK